MKRIIAVLLLAVGWTLPLIAQDDVYFVPSKKSQEEKTEPRRVRPETVPSPRVCQEVEENETWAAADRNADWDVDRYNRRTRTTDDSVDAADYDETDYETPGECTTLLVRFHSPRFGVFVSSPFYYDFLDYWYDPWFDWAWYGWYGWGRPYWAWGWGGPWWGFSWGWGPSWAWTPHHWHHPRPLYGNGPHGGYVAYGRRNTLARPSRNFGNTRRTWNRPSRNYAPNRRQFAPSRDYGRRPSNNFRSPSRPSRNFGNPGVSPSRSFGNSGSGRVSTPSRSFGSGGRSFGGGRGRR